MKPDIKIIYEDEGCIVIYKPAGLSVQTARASEEDVCSKLKNHLKGGYLGVIHRLDQPVEGLLVFAKNKKTAAALSEQLQSGKLKKSYKAVVSGEVRESGTDVCYMRKNASSECEIGEGEDFKRAELSYEPLASKDGTTLLNVKIGTGRFHQIRAQLSHLGFPILGDLKYGSDESKEKSAQAGVKTVALCADHLEYFDVSSGKIRKFDTRPQNKAFEIYDL
ncbi:MAG: RNA pseudouridine synthase [Lachnospiraceae bacterium]|nr:RNA pseudouridine synthase [Lachnospiraceae bacterium]